MASRISMKAATMSNTTRPTPAEIRAFRAENPKMRERDIAAQLGISEAALVAAEVGLTAVRIDGSANRFLERSEALGEVMALTRNESVVHEKIGVYEKINTGKHASIVLGENIVGPARWLGVLMPSVDAVGRYFPLIIAAPCGLGDEPLSIPWFSRVSAAALDGLERDLDAARFDTALTACFQNGIAAPELAQVGDDPSWPAPGHSLWLTEPGGISGWQMRCTGLPLGERFDALFGFLDGAWVDHLGAAT